MKPPAMTPSEIGAHPNPHPSVRVSCYLHHCTLYVGDEPPEGGAEAVAKAAGCPSWKSKDPTVFADCPVPAEIAAAEPLVTPDGPPPAAAPRRL